MKPPIIENMWKRHEYLMDALPPITKEAWKQSALSEPDTAEKDRYYLLNRCIYLEAELKYLRSEVRRVNGR